MSQRHLGRDTSGVAAIEFAFVAPMLLTLVVGAAIFGIALNNYIELTGAVQVGARQLAISRGTSSPYTSTVSAVDSALSNLTTSSLTLTISVNGTACSTDTSCANDYPSTPGGQATVTGTYPCQLVVMGYNFAPSCTLSSSTTEMIE